MKPILEPNPNNIGVPLSYQPCHRRDITFVIEGLAWMYSQADRWMTVAAISEAVQTIRQQYKWMEDEHQRSMTECIPQAQSAPSESMEAKP